MNLDQLIDLRARDGILLYFSTSLLLYFSTSLLRECKDSRPSTADRLKEEIWESNDR